MYIIVLRKKYADKNPIELIILNQIVALASATYADNFVHLFQLSGNRL